VKLKDLIELLEKFPSDLLVAQGFGNPHSWRGVYSELAFEPVDDTTVGDMLSEARSAIGETYYGHKGGEFTMTLETQVNVDYQGRWSDGEHDHRLYSWMAPR
jgi:hypothetical protein